jgi:SAM-dependent methyltransferase
MRLNFNYPLGSDPAELDRLDHQGRLLAHATRLIFEAAGLRPGMRVLDLGSGAGDVAFVIADLVGPSGEVIGIDRSPEACAKATARAQQRGVRNVRFSVGDVRVATAQGGVDAIVCRLLLMYIADPAALLRTQATQLRSGGLVVPIELDLGSARSVAATPLLSQVLAWIGEAFLRAGIHDALGPRLWGVARDAGLRPQGMLGVQPYFAPDNDDGTALLAGVVRAVLPLIERTGVATTAQVGIDTLQQRLTRELTSAGVPFAHPALVSAWATTD